MLWIRIRIGPGLNIVSESGCKKNSKKCLKASSGANKIFTRKTKQKIYHSFKKLSKKIVFFQLSTVQLIVLHNKLGRESERTTLFMHSEPRLYKCLKVWCNEMDLAEIRFIL
jgi:hypothetical protein